MMNMSYNCGSTSTTTKASECLTYLKAVPLITSVSSQIGKLNNNYYQSQHYKSESLFSMSIKQIDYLRTK